MLAVVGMVVAFSLSSTLVKRAESPGVLVAFWRMVCVSVVWNAVLWTTGRHITMANVRQAFLPGVFFGLNLAVFFAGATHNSVANAALIGSLAPFFIVPVGAWLFGEYIDPRGAAVERDAATSAGGSSRGPGRGGRGAGRSGRSPRLASLSSAITSGSPNARRSRVTFDCSVFRRVSAAPCHSSSTSRSVRTNSPASSARRTSSSDVLPPGTGRG